MCKPRLTKSLKFIAIVISCLLTNGYTALSSPSRYLGILVQKIFKEYTARLCWYLDYHLMQDSQFSVVNQTERKSGAKIQWRKFQNTFQVQDIHQTKAHCRILPWNFDVILEESVSPE